MRRLGISVVGNSARDKIDLAKRAEAAGFAMVFTSDDPGQDTFVALAAIACNTSTITIGAGICRSFIRHPVVTASAAADVDELSNGRLILGLATGTKRQNLYQYGITVDRPAAQLREVIQIMRGVWRHRTEAPFSFSGRFYTIPQLRYHDPWQPRDQIPIYLGAVNRRMAQLAGELCEGMAGHPCYTRRYIEGVIEPNVALGLARAGRSRASFDLARWICTVVDDDPERARFACKMGLGNYLATRSYGSLLDFHGWTAQKEAIQHAFFQQRDMTAVARAVTDDILQEMGIAGTPAQAREQLLAHWDSCDIPVLIPSGRFSSAEERYRSTRLLIDTFAPLLT
ncbi:MAG: LLM class flavin-dependent oxidoreductase [Chloroflexota bacterium]|nr:LLM class flavin-dependent oxidoreductase [Dehalococcoidia bacterium]MDW8254197.1 LLM class flavin-dependent oxidoreductase [Chloroflexota bacterium]